jgi:hypothetical protein
LDLLRDPAEQGAVGDDEEQPRLAVQSAGRLDGRIDDFGDDALVDGLGGVLAHSPACEYRFEEFHRPSPIQDVLGPG